MNEVLLQYIWQRKLLFDQSLYTTDGESLIIIHSGKQNPNAGPDFLHACIKIDNTQWIGNIEIHVNASDWHKHKHDKDPNYNNIILHIVYHNDVPIQSLNCPTLELSTYLDQKLLLQYDTLMNSEYLIPCQDQIKYIPMLTWSNWIERLFISRLERKTQQWHTTLLKSQNNWRQLLYERLAYNFGFHVNNEAFLHLAQHLPLKILSLHKDNIFQLEALLFGQAGWLEINSADLYCKELEKEYHFLRRKYKLIPLNPQIWKFMRMRPSNFPTVRLAQFAMLIHKSQHLFQQFMDIVAPHELLKILDVATSPYWETHYRFNETAKNNSVKHLGKDAILNIYINTVLPIQYLYYSQHKNDHDIENNLGHLIDAAQNIKPEINKITNNWKSIGILSNNGLESQALIELFSEYCTKKRCLACAVGNKILSS